MEDEVTADAAYEAVEQAIGGVMAGSLVTAWVVVAEVMDADDGRRRLTSIRPGHVTPWAATGMLSTADSYFSDDDDD